MQIICIILLLLSLSAHAATVEFSHMADASAGEWLGNNLIVVANDEDNLLRVYNVLSGGAPVVIWDFASMMALSGKSLETDLEGSAIIGTIIYWISSHAPNKNGKPRPNRRRFFATSVGSLNGVPHFELLGRPVTTLLESLASDPHYQSLHLLEAALKPPKTDGSLNIEALCDTAEGTLFIGFRSPLHGNKAMLAPLLNPQECVKGVAPQFAAPIFLDLQGNGIRAMVRLQGSNYLIMSGSALSGGKSRLYIWDGGAVVHPITMDKGTFPSNFTPESLIVMDLPDEDRLLVLSDDGTLLVDGQPAKEHPLPVRRTFRACRIKVPQLPKN